MTRFTLLVTPDGKAVLTTTERLLQRRREARAPRRRPRLERGPLSNT